MNVLSQREARVRRELLTAAYIPYTAQVSDELVRTRHGDYVMVLRLSGISFECADEADINQWHERLNLFLRNIAHPQIALWVTTIRRREAATLAGGHPEGFAAALAAAYRARLAGERLFANEHYLSIVYRPQPTKVGSGVTRLLRRTGRLDAAEELGDALEFCGKLKLQVRSALDRYEPEFLSIYKESGRPHSSVLEFLALLVNGEWQRMPLPSAPLSEALATSRPFFGTEAMEYRTPTASRLGAFLAIKEYPSQTSPGILNGLLTADFPFVLTQSFTFLPKSTAQALLKGQMSRLRNAGDLAVSQTEELTEAMDAVACNDVVMGDHHFSLQVLTDPIEQRTDDRIWLKRLNDSLAAARTILADAGMVIAREDLGLEAAHHAQLPGNFSFRARKAAITSRNFAALAPFHNFPTGRAVGNHWGEAALILKTQAGTAFHMSFHATDPNHPEGGSRKDIGHTFVCGPTGSGKTVFLGFAIAMLTRFAPTQVVFDKDRGLDILVRALGGRYLPLKNGEPTGFNPLQLLPTAANTEFLRLWLRRLVERPGRPLSVPEEMDLDQALLGTLSLDPASRRLSRLREFLDPTDPDGLHARLTRWCMVARGEYGWVFDHPEDRVAPLLKESTLVGFDVTDFLDHPTTRGPITLYLFHLVRQLLDGRRLIVWMDEFAKLLSDPAFSSFAKDGLKTWRKMNAFCVFATQSASDVLESPIARTLIEQTPTKVFFPNPDAHIAESLEGLSLSRRQVALVKDELEPGDRSFLLKQGHHAMVCELDLEGMAGALDVISGRTESVEIVDQLIRQLGEAPDRWLPKFLAIRGRRRSSVGSISADSPSPQA